MKIFIFFLCMSYLTYPNLASSIFSIQETLTILCRQFPLVDNVNNSNLQCARLRLDENVPTTNFNLNTPTQLILFIIIDQSLSQPSSIDITIHFNQSLDSPSLINDIRLGILVSQSNFTINNQTTRQYTPHDIPIFHWTNSTDDLIDVIEIEDHIYENDISLCKWNSNQWNRILNGNTSFNVPYVYFLKTTNSQLIFTLIDTNNTSKLSSPPSPYLNILYCIPYKLGVTEMILIICLGVFFIIVIILLLVFRYLRGGEDNRTKNVEQNPSQTKQDKTHQNNHNLRHRKSESMSRLELDDQHSD